MPSFRVTYVADRPSEIVQADRMKHEPSADRVLLYRAVPFMNQTREVVVRRLLGHEVEAVTECEPS